MPHGFTRRQFLGATLGATAALPLGAARGATAVEGKGAPAVHGGGGLAVASSANGHPAAVTKALELLAAGADTLDAAVAGVNLVEDDPSDQSVGLGGLPNEDGIVELDASCMHGPTSNAGAVASLRNVRNPSSVARDVLWHTDHVLLVGEGALTFARRRGFKEENLLTDASREAWLNWKSRLSPDDDWLEPWEKRPELKPVAAGKRTTGTINFNVCNARGEVSGVTSTSGLAWKLPGRVGDSPIIGCGLYVDGLVGAAGSTGRGEAVIVAGGARTVVEAMSRGHHPQDACLEAVRRVLRMNRMPYLWGENGRPRFGVQFYAVDIKGRFGGASIFPARLAVGDGNGSRLADCAHEYPA